MGLNTIRLSGNTFDHFRTPIANPEEKHLISNSNKQYTRDCDRVAILEQLANIQRIIERRRALMTEQNFSEPTENLEGNLTEAMPTRLSQKVRKCDTKKQVKSTSAIPRPSSKQSFVHLHQVKMSTRTPRRLFPSRDDRKSDDGDISLDALRITSKPKSTPVTVLTPIKRDKLTCTCDHCETRKFERQRVGFDRSERLRIHQQQQKFVDPMKGASQALIERLRELKSYDLDTAKQEQSESKRRKKKKV